VNAFREIITWLRFTLEIHFSTPLNNATIKASEESDLCLHLGLCSQSSGIAYEEPPQRACLGTRASAVAITKGPQFMNGQLLTLDDTMKYFDLILVQQLMSVSGS
jgi:hypothetical protein